MRTFCLMFAGLAVLAGGCASRAVPPQVLARRPAPDPSVPPVAQPPAQEPPSSQPALTVVAPDSDVVNCALIGEPGERIATVALGDTIDPANAPHPTNDSERLLFRQLYETLVRVDCEGKVRPALATSWRLDPATHEWIVTLRENARFSDDMPVTTADVVSSLSLFVPSIVPVDDRTLAITLRGEQFEAPVALADTDLAVTKRAPGASWPLGTRAVRVASDSATQDAKGRSVITLTGVDNSWSVRFVIAPGGDTRDFLDEGVDLLITRDRAALGYAATLPQFVSVPLAWRLTYAFISPWGTRYLAPMSVEARQTLADEAVRGEARGAEGPFWWQAVPNCDIAPPPVNRPASPAPTAGRIVYDRSDEAARDLADRFVGLGTFQRSIGLTREALALAQQRGTEAGYIVSFDRRPLDPCQALRAAVDRFKWLDPDTIVPLVDTRLRAIARRGHAGVTAEWDGGLVIK